MVIHRRRYERMSGAQVAAWATTRRYWLSRYKLGTAVFWPTGERFELAAWLERQGRQSDVAIQLGAEAHLPCRLIAVRVPAAVVCERRADLAAEARDEQREVSAAAWTLARWTILVTNCPLALLSGEEALALGEARWQIELVMKRWKSLGQIDEWQTAKPQRILTEIYAKLLVQVLQHWLLVLGCWREPGRSLWRGVQEVQRWGGRWPGPGSRAAGRRRWRMRWRRCSAAGSSGGARTPPPTNGC